MQDSQFIDGNKQYIKFPKNFVNPLRRNKTIK